MSTISEKELSDFRNDAAAWFAENTNADPGFMLPLTFMEVGTDQQFNFLRDWQNKVYEAGYLGAAWPKEYGGGGNAQTKAVRDGDDWVLNGSKIWTTQGNYAKYMILLARTNPDAPNKYAGLSFFLSPMQVEGIETVPIRKLTGEYGFTQTFFTDARIPGDSLMGKEGEGWLVAMRTLEYERGVKGGQPGGYVMRASDPFEIVELARKATRGGKPALEDPVIKDQLIQLMIEARSLQLNSKRGHIQPLVQDKPASLALSSKLMATEFMRRLNEFAITLQGQRGAYYVGEPDAYDEGLWQRAYLNSFSATIGGGTSQIQRNIIGEHVLGLPKS